MSTVIHGKDSITGSTDPVNLSDNKLHIAQYVWDTNTLSWIRQTGGGTSPGTDVTVTNFPATQVVVSPTKQLKVDSSNPATVYVGEANLGVAASSAGWTIQEISIAGPLVGIKVSSTTAVWDDRTTTSYS